MVATFEQLRTKNLKTFDELRKKPKPPDYGRVALPKERLPGVWDYDKQLDQLLGDPEIDIEKMMPLDVRYDFGKIVGMTEKPDETKDRLKSSLYYSIIFGKPPEITFNVLDKLNEIATGVKMPAATAWGRIKDRYRGGKKQVQAMDFGFDLLKRTWHDWEAYEKSVETIEKLQSGVKDDVRRDFRGFFEKTFGAAAEQLPILWETVKESPVGALAGGFIGAAMAIMGGLTVPAPEEVITIPAATIKGAAVGAGVRGAIRIGQLEAGGMFLEIAQMEDSIGNKVDPKIAAVACYSVGTINGAIEMAEWAILLSTFGIGTKLFEKSAAKVTSKMFAEGTLKNIVAKNVLKYGAALGAETLQEIEQETSNVVFGELAKELNNARKGTDFKPISAEDLKGRYREVTVESLRAFGVILAPGISVSTAIDIATRKPEVVKPTVGVKEVKAEIPPTEPIAAPEKPTEAITPEKPPVTPTVVKAEPRKVVKTAKYDKASIQSATEAVKRTNPTEDRYIYATAEGFIITKEPPIDKNQSYRVVHPDYSYEDVQPFMEGEEARIAGRRKVLQERVRRGEPTPEPLLREFKSEKWAQEALAQPVVKAEPTKGVIKIPRGIRGAEVTVREITPPKDIKKEGIGMFGITYYSPTHPGKTYLKEEYGDKWYEIVSEAEPTKIVIPESEKDWAKRSKVIKKELEKEIESVDVYQDEIRAQGERAEEFQVGRIYFEKKYKGEINEAIENHPSLMLHITYDKTKGAPWDGIIQERLGRYLEGVEVTQAHMDVSEFLEKVAEVTEHKKKIGKLNIRALDVLSDSGDIYFETLAAKYDMMQQGFTAEEMNENIREIALDYPEVPSDYVEKLLIPIVEGEPSVEDKQRMVEEVETKARPLRQKIHAIAAKKGLTKKALSDLKLKHTGYRHLTGKISKAKITTEQLQKLLKAVQKARPKQVGYKKVITKKTEKKIQSLKENLVRKTQMTERHYDQILEIEVHGKEPKYTDARNFITETQGKDILRRMLDTAEIVRLTESFEQAIAKNPEITDRVKLLDSRIAKAPKRDPYSLESMRYYNQQAEVKTGAPIFTSYMDLLDTHLDIIKTRTATWKRLEKTTAKFKEIAKDEDALRRVGDYIASQSTLKEKPAMPTDITADEIKLAKEIQKILEEYRIKVRVSKFYNWYYYNQPIPDHDRYTREITKAVDIYESKGKEELIEYLETQEWGVIKSGYEPLEILFHKIRPYTTGPTAVGKGHVKIRTDIEYHKQERNILQRLSAYMRQIDTLYNMSPKINAYVRLYDDNASKFSDWGKVKNDVEIFLRNLKRYNIEGGFFQRTISRAYSQAMRVIIMPSPVLSFRNLFQNAAFEHDKSILIDPRNTELTNKDIEYLETYVLQTRAMVEEYFMVGEKPLPGLRILTKLIDKLKLYPYSDIANRHWSFWAKTNQVSRALKAETTKQMMTEAKFEDMKELEQRRALAILARDGKEAMTQYVGRVHVDDIHFLYERAQRSPAEMTALGKIVGNLMLFPRAYGEKLAHVANKTLKGKTYQEQWRGLKTLFAVVGGGMIVGSIYTMITGRKRNPYNPLEILAFRPGGLAWGSVEAATEIYANILTAAKGDSRALAALTVAIPRAADMFIPFYDYTLRAIEAATDQKNIDRKALRKMRMMIDKEYKIRGGAYKVKRNALEKWQYFISGPSAEKEEEKKAKPKKITR